MSKALLVTLQYPPRFGGVETYLAGVVHHVPRQSIEVLAPGSSHEETLDGGVHTLRSPFLTAFVWPRWLPLFIRLFVLTIRRRYTLLIAGQVLPTGTAVFLVAKLTRTPYAVFAHGMDVLVSQHSPRKRTVSRKVFSSAVRVFCPSTYTRQLVIAEGVSPDRCEIMRPCVDASKTTRTSDEFRQSVRDRFGIGDGVIVLTVARLVKRKGHALILQALARIRDDVPHFQYVIVGDGPLAPSIDAEITRLHLDGVVLRTSAVDEHTLSALYESAHLFVLPVLPDPEEIDVEGFGIVYQEALAHHIAVIASDVGGVRDAVGDAARLIEPGDSEQLSLALSSLMSRPEEREVLIERGKRLTAVRTWEHEVLPLVNLIRHSV